MKGRMKKTAALVLATALSLSMFAGCKDEKGDSSAKQKDSVKLWYAYNTENLMKDVEYPELIEARDSTLRMHCLKKDVETVQLMVTPSVNVASFDFKMNDLKNANGDILKADTFNL